MTSDSEQFQQFRALHQPGTPLLLPNAWDFASAAALAAEGFPAVATTSLGVSAASGKADSAGATLPETLALTRMLRPVPALISVDAEGGFSDRPEEAAATVAGLASAGAVGVNLEDGRSDGTLRPAALHAEIVAAVKDQVPEVFVNARTDVFLVGDGRAGEREQAQERAEAYVKAGADGIFMPGVTDADTIAVLAKETAAPLNVLFQPGELSVPDLALLGVARVSLGSMLMRAALHTVTSTARAVRDGGTDVAQGALSYASVAALLGPEG